ncbi:MAG TPA: hypothetical protein DEB69_02595 [Candidatus Komeilibacteria bacterium]|nr:hypothetical protein [Candidatus Komeilibacteria bacterium]
MTNKDFYNNYWQQRGASQGTRLRYQILTDWLKPGSQVLDIGGGDGYLGAMLTKEKNCIVTVMDISEEALRLAEKRGLAVNLGNVEEKFPFADSSFDTVIMSEVLEHVALSEEALKEARRVARESVYVTVPNTGYYKYRLQLLFGRFPKQWLIDPKEHLRFWTYADFKKTLLGLGFKIEKVKAGAGRRYLRDWWKSLFAEQLCYKLKK